MKENIRLFMVDMGIDCLDDIALLYHDYLTECDGLLAQILVQIPPITHQGWVELEQIIHNIKGVSANLYVKNVFEKAIVLDDFLKESLQGLPDMNLFLLLWQEFLAAYSQGKKEILQFFQ